MFLFKLTFGDLSNGPRVPQPFNAAPIMVRIPHVTFVVFFTNIVRLNMCLTCSCLLLYVRVVSFRHIRAQHFDLSKYILFLSGMILDDSKMITNNST